jgi:hypothetical protein
MWLVAYLTWRELRPATSDPATRLRLSKRREPQWTI